MSLYLDDLEQTTTPSDSILTTATEIVKTEKAMLAEILKRLDDLENRIDKVKILHEEAHGNMKIIEYKWKNEMRNICQEIIEDAKYSIHD